MKSLSQSVIDFINQIPAQINPYSTLAKYLLHLIQPPRTPLWAVWLQRVFLLGFAIILIQASHFVFSRLRAGKVRILSVDELGLLNIHNLAIALAYVLYSSLVIADMVLDEIFRDNHDLVGIKAMLFGCKFLVILNCSWLFLWTCVRQCASLKWSSSSHGRSFGHNMPRIVPWVIHLTFISLMLWPIPIVLWQYWNARAQYNYLLHIMLNVIKSLRDSAATVTPATYKKYQLLLAVSPAEQAVPLLGKMAKSVQLGIEAYLINIVILCSAYIPFLIYSLRALYLRGLSEKYYVESLVDASPAELRRFRMMSYQTHKQWKSVVLHALIAYAGTLAHVPVIVWQMTIKGYSFLQDPTWQLVTRLGLHGPFAVVGILSLYYFYRNEETSLLPDHEESCQFVSPIIKPSKESTGPQESLSEPPETKTNTVYFDLARSLKESKCERTSQEIFEVHHFIAQGRPSRTRDRCTTLLEEAANSSTVLTRSVSVSSRRKPVDFQVLAL